MRKVKRFLVGIVAIATMLVTTISPAFASTDLDVNADESVESVEPRAGTETWTGSGFGGSYTFTDTNTTPVKTMGKSGTLLISGYFYGDDGYASSHPIVLTVEIRSTSGAVLGRTSVIDDRSGAVDFAVSAPVSAGQKIQLFFDASSAYSSPGIYRSAYVNYYYDL